MQPDKSLSNLVLAQSCVWHEQEPKDLLRSHPGSLWWGVKKVRAQLELNLTRGTKNNKDFFRYIGQQRKMKETVPAIMGKTEGLVTTNKEKAEGFLP